MKGAVKKLLLFFHSPFLSCFELKSALAELGGVLRARVNVLFLAIILR